MTDMSGIGERQQREQAHFDEEPAIREVNFDHYSRPEFGPWNPYWLVYDLVRREFREPTQRLLSFGCGQGANALRYCRLGYEVHGFDISGRSIETAQALAERYALSERMHFSVQGAETLSYPSDHFDVIAGENILHHVNIGRAVKEAHRVLKPGGLAVFKEPLESPIRDRIRRSAPIRWVVPIGVKNLRRGTRYHHPPDTVKLTDLHLRAIRETFGSVEIVPFRVVALFNVLTRSPTFLEKCDLMLFKLIPPARKLGDMAVIVVRKRDVQLFRDGS